MSGCVSRAIYWSLVLFYNHLNKTTIRILMYNSSLILLILFIYIICYYYFLILLYDIFELSN
jgi:hypothetical protein